APGDHHDPVVECAGAHGGATNGAEPRREARDGDGNHAAGGSGGSGEAGAGRWIRPHSTLAAQPAGPGGAKDGPATERLALRRGSAGGGVGAAAPERDAGGRVPPGAALGGGPDQRQPAPGGEIPDASRASALR